jgi:ATP-dependent protease HslVU (ClpYQ) ATPase subunit
VYTYNLVVSELDKYIIGQGDAKKAVAIALRKGLSVILLTEYRKPLEETSNSCIFER